MTSRILRQRSVNQTAQQARQRKVQSCTSNPSPWTYQSARDAHWTCRSGATRSGSSKAPAGTIASPPLRVRCGMGLPHVLQNAVAKLRAWGRSKRAIDCSPRSHRSAGAFTITSHECARPGRLSAARAMAVQEEIERPLNLKRDHTAQATPPECRHSRLLARYERPEVECFFRFGAKKVAEKRCASPPPPRCSREKTDSTSTDFAAFD